MEAFYSLLQSGQIDGRTYSRIGALPQDRLNAFCAALAARTASEATSVRHFEALLARA